MKGRFFLLPVSSPLLHLIRLLPSFSRLFPTSAWYAPAATFLIISSNGGSQSHEPQRSFCSLSDGFGNGMNYNRGLTSINES